jgi:hypothetical protein
MIISKICRKLTIMFTHRFMFGFKINESKIIIGGIDISIAAANKKL